MNLGDGVELARYKVKGISGSGAGWGKGVTDMSGLEWPL